MALDGVEVVLAKAITPSFDQPRRRQKVTYWTLFSLTF